jgi:hypothetical protein
MWDWPVTRRPNFMDRNLKSTVLKSSRVCYSTFQSVQQCVVATVHDSSPQNSATLAFYSLITFSIIIH